MRIRATTAGVLLVLGGTQLACGRTHPQLEGTYDFAAVEVLGDECGLLQDPSAAWAADLFIAGHFVRMQARPQPASSSSDYRQYGMYLGGLYRSGMEEFFVDGSVGNAVVTLPAGQECLLDLINIHLEAATESPTAFQGTLAIRYEARHPDACTCELWTRYRAALR